MFGWFKKQEEKAEEKKKSSFFGAFDTNASVPNRETMYQKSLSRAIKVQPTTEANGQDASNFATTQLGGSVANINPYAFDWFAAHSFIGFQACSVIGQHWLVAKACTVPAKDAIRKGWDVSRLDGKEVEPETLDKIKELDKHKYKIKEKLVNQSHFTKVFGIRLALFKVESTDTEYYEKPFNIDGIRKGSYKGIVQIDPYWATPFLTHTNSTDPTQMGFYEPEYWNVFGKKIHKSHLVITRGEEVADVLKPTYQYAGLSMSQKIYERVYASERTANEAPQLAESKRLNWYKTESLVEAMADKDGFTRRMQQWIDMRDNYGVKFIGADDEIGQLETNLANLDEVIMSQYQIVCSIANIPAYKLLGTALKGFSSGETEEASYHEELENIQDFTMEPLLDKHYQLLVKSDLQKDFNPTVVWDRSDSMTTKEVAEVNNLNSQTAMNLSNTGGIDGEMINNAITKDKNSPYYGMENDIEIEPDDNLELGEALDYIEKEDNQYYVFSEEGKKLSKGYASKEEAEKRLAQIEYFKALDEITEDAEDAEYKGKKVTLNKPFRDSEGSKKFGVYVKNDKGNIVKVGFGDPKMKIRRDDPEARKNFRARHDCENKTDKTKAGYWSCKFWSAKSVNSLLK